jgi:hypothetical protein
MNHSKDIRVSTVPGSIPVAHLSETSGGREGVLPPPLLLLPPAVKGLKFSLAKQMVGLTRQFNMRWCILNLQYI